MKKLNNVFCKTGIALLGVVSAITGCVLAIGIMAFIALIGLPIMFIAGTTQLVENAWKEIK